MSGIRIVSTGRYIPDTIVTNDDMAGIVETSDEWISTRTGIRTRRVVAGEPTFFMAASAAKQALEGFSGTAADIDMIVCSTITPDFHTPSVSCLVQEATGAVNAFCIDISCACTGFVQAVDMAQKYISAGEVKTVLVVSAEVLSRIVDFTDRETCVLFGDGAGACIVQGAAARYTSFFGADGSGSNSLYATQFYPCTPFESEAQRRLQRREALLDDGFIHMDGRAVYKFSTAAIQTVIEKACGKLGIVPGDISLIIPHQANERIVATAMKRLGLPIERAFLNIAKFGNTSSASIPIALDEVARLSLIKPGELCALVGFGAGLTFGAAIFEW